MQKSTALKSYDSIKICHQTICSTVLQFWFIVDNSNTRFISWLVLKMSKEGIFVFFQEWLVVCKNFKNSIRVCLSPADNCQYENLWKFNDYDLWLAICSDVPPRTTSNLKIMKEWARGEEGSGAETNVFNLISYMSIFYSLTIH